jgi:hypothetical protein
MTIARALRVALGGQLALAAPLALIAVLAIAPGAVLADCAQPPPIGDAVLQADIVFVGTVTSTTNGGRWAEVAVAEIWKGPDQPATVVVRGGPAGNTATSVDRAFEPGVQYLFVPYKDETGALTDNICTSTTQWDASLELLRPGDARQPTGGAPTQAGFDVAPLLPFGVAAAVFAVLLAVGLLARGRQES